MKAAVSKVCRILTVTLVTVAFLNVSAYAKSPKKEEDQHRKGNSTTKISITVSGDTATITSGKEISHVVIWYCDPFKEVKYEEDELLPYLDSTGKEATFFGSPMMSVMAKSGTSTKMILTSCAEGEIEEYSEDDR